MSDTPTILLPEGHDQRVERAARQVAQAGWARIVLIDHGMTQGQPIHESPLLERWSLEGWVRHRLTGLDTLDNLSWQDVAAVSVSRGLVDGAVLGATCESSHVIRSGIRHIGMAPHRRRVTGAMIVEPPRDAGRTHPARLIFADAIVIEEPTAEELAEIALGAVEISSVLDPGEEPRLAFLSYSTHGATDRYGPLIREAIRRFEERARESPVTRRYRVDGPLQLDAAIDPEVGRYKAGQSPVAGQANALIFPNLAAANIGYKLAQRLTGAVAFGVLSGLRRPYNDLSRGCTAQDIVATVWFTARQSRWMEGAPAGGPKTPASQE